MDLSTRPGDLVADFTTEGARVLWDATGGDRERSFERAGPRQRVYFRGEDVVAGVVTCGGLCPGMNNVIRSVVLRLWYAYGVRRIWGFRYGYAGLGEDPPAPPSALDPEAVVDVHLQGGSFLGSSRGPREPAEMVDTLERLGVNALFCIGGDGTLRGAHAIYEEARDRGLELAVVGIPKTIDNDILHVQRTFGFETAVTLATQAIQAAHVEARGAPRGIGLVRLMGRHSGFIAATASLASGEVNLCLVPEVPFELDGKGGVIAWLRERVDRRGHAVVVVAEGAGQEHLPTGDERDASGNLRLADIGTFLEALFSRDFSDLGVSVKYIDPSYIIRAAPANSVDAVYCGQLAENAVHAAMAGHTDLVVASWSGLFTEVPLPVVTAGRKVIEVDGPFWRSVVESTGQPSLFVNRGGDGAPQIDSE